MNDMKIKYFSLLAVIAVMAFGSCDVDPTPLTIIKPYEYDAQYYQNLRDYKATDHTVSFGWFAKYKANAQTSSPLSKGLSFSGMPDSLDICSLWAGVPSNDPESDAYDPFLYNDMKFVQKVKGTKMVWVKFPNMKGFDESFGFTQNDEGAAKFAEYLCKEVLRMELDGLEIDYEPGGAEFLANTAAFGRFIQECGKYLGPGPESPRKDLMLIVDYYNHSLPNNIEPYINYLVKQAYTQGFTQHSNSRLQTYYNGVASWLPPAKFIVTEKFDSFSSTGGSPFVDGSLVQMVAPDGVKIFSLEGMARWNPTQGRKGGFGAFHADQDYNNAPGYYYYRRCIQICNPAVK